MARHKQQHARDTSDVPSIPGGAAGIPVEETNRQTPQARRQSDEPERVATQYMITDGPRDSSGSIPFNSDGYVVKLRPGKIVSETTHDLELMRRQGIKLDPMPADDAPESGEIEHPDDEGEPREGVEAQ